MSFFYLVSQGKFGKVDHLKSPMKLNLVTCLKESNKPTNSSLYT